jgi:hypothetical protein
MNGKGNIHNKAVVCGKFDIPASDLQTSFLQGRNSLMIILVSDTSPPVDKIPLFYTIAF